MRHTLRNRDSTNFLREIRVGLRASRKGPFGTKEKRVPALEKERLQFFQRLLRPLDRETRTRKNDYQSIIMDFRPNGERSMSMGGGSEDIPRALKCANVNFDALQERPLAQTVVCFLSSFLPTLCARDGFVSTPPACREGKGARRIQWGQFWSI